MHFMTVSLPKLLQAMECNFDRFEVKRSEKHASADTIFQSERLFG